MELYNRIRARRESLGLSQDELAKKMGYKDRSTIAKIETGINDITQSKIEAFAVALDTSPAYLMGWVDDPEERAVVATIADSEREAKIKIAREYYDKSQISEDEALRLFELSGIEMHEYSLESLEIARHYENANEGTKAAIRKLLDVPDPPPEKQ